MTISKAAQTDALCRSETIYAEGSRKRAKLSNYGWPDSSDWAAGDEMSGSASDSAEK